MEQGGDLHFVAHLPPADNKEAGIVQGICFNPFFYNLKPIELGCHFARNSRSIGKIFPGNGCHRPGSVVGWFQGPFGMFIQKLLALGKTLGMTADNPNGFKARVFSPDKTVDNAELNFTYYGNIRITDKKVIIFVDRTGQAVFDRDHAETSLTFQNRIEHRFKEETAIRSESSPKARIIAWSA